MSDKKSALSRFNKYERRVKYWFPILERWLPFAARRLAVYVFFHPFRFASPKAEFDIARKARPYSFVSREQMLQGYKWGSGPVVVFVHGWSGRALQVRAFVEPLVQAGFEVIAFDAPGHGFSPGDTADITSFAAAIQNLVKDQGHIYGLIGHSLGGGACLLAVKQGVRVEKLVVISTPAIPEEIKDQFLARIGANQATGDYLEKAIQKRQGYTLDELSAKNSAADLPPVKTLLIYDEDDTDVPLHHGELLHQTLKNADLMVTKQLGHLRILRNTEVVAAVRKFLTK